MGNWSSRLSKGKESFNFCDYRKEIGVCQVNSSRWTSLDELDRHHEREWLQQMYLDIEVQRLLDGEEEIQFLKIISGFTCRCF
jgi:hypothetical protein